MINRNIGRLRLELYSSVDELPIERFGKFNIYCLLAAGIGNDVESVNKHLEELYKSAYAKDFEKLKTQLYNYHHSLNAILNGERLETSAFACLVHSINGKEVNDLSEEGIKWITTRILRAEKTQMAFNLFAELKKKLRTNLKRTSLKK